MKGSNKNKMRRLALSIIRLQNPSWSNSRIQAVISASIRRKEIELNYNNYLNELIDYAMRLDINSRNNEKLYRKYINHQSINYKPLQISLIIDDLSGEKGDKFKVIGTIGEHKFLCLDECGYFIMKRSVINGYIRKCTHE